MKTDRILKYTVIGTAAAVILMMAAATVIERLYGTDRAFSIVYHSPVFIVLWAVAAISGILLLLSAELYASPPHSFFTYHSCLYWQVRLLPCLPVRAG